MPKHCEKCGDPLVSEYFDARTPTGRWGNFCANCFHDFDGSLGIGSGQQYRRTFDADGDPNPWVQVAGGSQMGKEFP